MSKFNVLNKGDFSSIRDEDIFDVLVKEDIDEKD